MNVLIAFGVIGIVVKIITREKYDPQATFDSILDGSYTKKNG